MTDKKLIYIADDEVNICNIIKSFLIKDGFEVEAFYDGATLLAAFEEKQSDMLIIDIMMPQIDGFSVCSSVRKTASTPIIIVSAKDTEPDKIAGLTLGGDDYLTKPFSPMELIARVRSIFRRIDLDKATSTKSNYEKVSDITINTSAKQVEYKGRSINLTGMEYTLLSYLVERKNSAVSRNELLDKIWGFENAVETRATDDMIKRIRKKLSDAGSILTIETIWGFGFKVDVKE